MKIRDIRHWLSVCDDVKANPAKYDKQVTISVDSMLMLADEIKDLRTKVLSLSVKQDDGGYDYESQ